MEKVEKPLYISMIFSAVFKIDYTTHIVWKKAKCVECKILLISPLVHAMLDANRRGVKAYVGCADRSAAPAKEPQSSGTGGGSADQPQRGRNVRAGTPGTFRTDAGGHG